MTTPFGTAILVISFAIGGTGVGLAADLLSRGWPAHLPGHRRRTMDWRTVIVAAMGALVFGGLAGRWKADPLALLFLCVIAVALLVLLATDLDQKILPDVVTLPLIAITALLLVLGWSPLLAGRQLGLVSGVAAGIGAPVFLFVTDRLLRGDLGAGDLKLAISVGLMCGVSLLIGGLLVASMAFAAVLLVLIGLGRIGVRSAVPFGPVLIFAAFVAMMIG